MRLPLTFAYIININTLKQITNACNWFNILAIVLFYKGIIITSFYD